MTVFDENSILRILPHFGEISLDNFSNRLRLQKISYLAQEIGLDGGFFFTYYHRGPYSPDLTRLLFRGVETQEFAKKELTEKETRIVKNLGTIFGSKVDDVRSLELFASVWYLLPSRKITKEDKKYVLDTILETKPRYNKDEVEETIDKAVSFKSDYGLEV